MIFHSIYSKRIVFFNQTEFCIYLCVVTYLYLLMLCAAHLRNRKNILLPRSVKTVKRKTCREYSTVRGGCGCELIFKSR
jgi:heme exporter protein D